jgi:hypothetical protein
MAFCINCGKENNGTSKFCVGCGKSMLLTNEAINTAPTKQFINEPKSKQNVYLVGGIISLLTIGAIIYFSTTKKDKKEEQTVSTNTISTATQQINTATVSSNNAEQKVRKYFDVATQRNFDNIYPYLENCTRYYSTNNPTRDDIYNDCSKYWDKVTDIEQTINSVRIEKTDYYNDCFVTMDYSFFSIKDQVQKYINSLVVKVRIDNNNNIIEIYEISRN